MNPKLINYRSLIGSVSLSKPNQVVPYLLLCDLFNTRGAPLSVISKDDPSEKPVFASRNCKNHTTYLIANVQATIPVNKLGVWVISKKVWTSEFQAPIVFIARLFFKQGHKQYNIRQHEVSRNIIATSGQITTLVKYSIGRVNDLFCVVNVLSQNDTSYLPLYQYLRKFVRKLLKMCDLQWDNLSENNDSKIIFYQLYKREISYYN